MSEIGAARDAPSAVLAAVAARSAAQMRTENFPVAMRLLPSRVRAELARVYGFARFVDDVGDEAVGDRLELLDLVEADVRALPAGRARLGPVVALGPAVLEHGIPLQCLLDLVEANRADQGHVRYETFDDLLAYCRLSAAPIGRVVLYIAGAATPDNVADSDAVCAALQVLEHCQDVGEDARAGRVYLPAEDLRSAGVEHHDLVAEHTGRPLRSVVATEVSRSRELLTAGIPLVRRLRGWARLAVAGYVAGGLATADALVASDCDVLGRDVRPARLQTARHAVRLIGKVGQ